jgi:hypothetical protein
MQKVIALVAVAALILSGSIVSSAQANPLSNAAAGSYARIFSQVERVGCTRAGDNCPYGQRIVRGGGHGWWCEPCAQNYGPKHGNWSGNYRDYSGGPPPAYNYNYRGGPPPGYDDERGPPPGYEGGPPPGWQPYGQRSY